MKKKIILIILAVIAVLFIIFGVSKNRFLLPNTYYQVYLDGELIGTIKSKEKLEKYINNRGILIKEKVLDYQKKIEIIDKFENIIGNNSFSDEVNASIGKYNLYKNYFHILKDSVDEDNTLKEENRLEEIILEDYEIDIDEDEVITNYDDVIEYFNNNIEESLEFISKNADSSILNEVDGYYFNEYKKEKYYEIDYSQELFMRDFIEEYSIYSYADNIYKPLGIKIEKINTYNKEYMNEDEMYEEIIKLKPCTIEGYQFRIKRENANNISDNVIFASLSTTPIAIARDYISNDLIVYTTDKKIFDDAIETFVEVFVGKDEYENYKNDLQEEIIDTGKRIDKMYLEQDITVKKTNISVKENIFTNSDDLTSYLLYGDNLNVTKVYAKSTDTISSFAYQNQISVEEFFLFNREFTSINNYFYEGQEITIARLNPQISMVVEEYSVEDKETEYEVIERYNDSINIGSRRIVQEGSNGVDRISQNVVKVNGTIKSVELLSKETIVGSTARIIEIGTRSVPAVGSLGSWGWPTVQGYTISSWFGYRQQVFGEGNFHTGIDIAGIPYGSEVYATNNGRIIMKGWLNDLGYHIMIDHNNGYYSLYAHLSGFPDDIELNSVVTRGQVIGYVGATGWATGTHLHFQIGTCSAYYNRGCLVDPWPYLMMR